MDICLLELTEDIIETGKMNRVLLQTICLPEYEALSGSSCFTSGINKASKNVDAVSLNLFSHTFCNEQHSYSSLGVNVNENQLCAGIPTKINKRTTIAPFKGKHAEDFGGPLICLDQQSHQPIFTGISSSNSLSTKPGQPGLIRTMTIDFDSHASLILIVTPFCIRELGH